MHALWFGPPDLADSMLVAIICKLGPHIVGKSECMGLCNYACLLQRQDACPRAGDLSELEAAAAIVSGEETVAGDAAVTGSKAHPSKWPKRNFSCRGLE